MGVPMGTKGDPNQRGNSRRWIIREVENSLRRLNTDWIDLYQVHRPDRDTDVEETLSGCDDLARRPGLSAAVADRSVPAAPTHRVARARGLAFVREAIPYRKCGVDHTHGGRSAS